MECIECIKWQNFTGLKLKGTVSDERHPIHTILCVDTSGSMDSDNKLENVKKSLKIFTKCLSAGDAVSLVTFDSLAKTILHCVEINDGNRILIENAVSSIKTDGSTNLSAGILSCYGCIETGATERKQSILLLTDGNANVGESNTDRLLTLCRNYFQTHQSLTMTVIGYGLDHNAELLKGMAVTGRGSYNLVNNLEDVASVFGSILGSLLSVICQLVKVEFSGNAKVMTSQVVLDGKEIIVGDIHSDEMIPVILEGECRDIKVSWVNCADFKNCSTECPIIESGEAAPEWMELAICQQRAATLIERSAKKEAGIKGVIEREIEELSRSARAGHPLMKRLIEELKEVNMRQVHMGVGGGVDVSMMQRSAVLGLGRGFSSPIGRMRAPGRAIVGVTEEEDDENNDDDPIAPQNSQMTSMSLAFRNMTQENH